MTHNPVSNDTSFDTFAKFRQDVRDCIDKARCIFGVNLDPHAVVIRLDVRGQVAGWASKKNGRYSLRFNPEAIIKHNDEMTNDTIPHEVAHLVCYANPKLGKDHDEGWKRVCRMLGGDDSRTHDMELTPAKVVRYYRYVLPSGLEVEVGPKHHKKLQAGYYPYLINRASKQRVYAVDYRPDPDHKAAASKPKPTLIQKVAQAANAFDTRSKKQIVADLFVQHPNATRGQMIELIMQHANMSKAGASTYYQSAKSQK